MRVSVPGRRIAASFSMTAPKAAFATLLLLGFALATPGYADPQPIPDIAPEHIFGYLTSGIYGWYYSYDIGLASQRVTVDVDIRLVGDDPGQSLRDQWQSGTESTWSGHYGLFDGAFFYPIVFSLDWVTANPDETVTVHSGTGPTDMLNWYTQNPSGWPNSYQGEIAAHEVGHMVGLYDEYPGGAVNPATHFVTTNALMADLGPVQRRYYTGFETWLEDESGRPLTLETVSPVPEPGAIVLLGTAIFGLVVSTKRRLKL